MIYILTNNKENFPDIDKYTISSEQELIEYITNKTELCIDTETTGFDPHTKKLLSLQIGDYDNQYLIDCRSVNILFLKELLESRLLVGQNLKFDLKFLYKQDIHPKKIYDTYIAEKVLTCGLIDIRAGLDTLCERYCGVIMDKSVRSNIPTEGLTYRIIKYAVEDVRHLSKIKDLQLIKARAQDLIGVLNLENRFTPCLAYIEYCGFKLDSDKWKLKMEQDLKQKDELRSKLDSYIIDNNQSTYIDKQLDFFSDEPKITINWDSPLQVIKFFEGMGLDCGVTTKGVTKKSVEATVLSKYEKGNEVVHIYLEYKKSEKVITTYGDTFLTQINPSTNRIHSKFTQILDTGRISSGGTDKDTSTKHINFQNIPADKNTRSCFVAEVGNTLVISDYSGQEQVVLANYSMDKSLLEFYDNGLADMHSFIASKMYPELEGLSLDEIKTKHKDKRQNAKSAGFAINYGGEGTTIATNQGITKVEGDIIYNAYFKAFPGLKEYFNKVKQSGLVTGYINISPITRRKSYISFFKDYLYLKEKFDSDYWIKYRKLKELGGDDFNREKENVREFFFYKGTIERKSLNYPIQGSSAEITKISCIYIYDYIITNNLFGIVKFVNTIHDENVLECPKELVTDIAEMVQTCMNKAALLFCKRVPLTATPEISEFWKK